MMDMLDNDIAFEEDDARALIPVSSRDLIDDTVLMYTDRIVTSHSIDGTFDSCPRRFEFLHLWQKAPERERSGFAADVGTALHEAVQAWARYQLTPKEWRLENPVPYGMTPADYGMYVLLQFWPWSFEKSQRLQSKAIGERTIGNSILLYQEIITHPMWDSWELLIVEDFGPSIEVPFAIVHTSMDTIRRPNGTEAFLVTQGKIDFLLRHRVTGEIRVFDLKTTVKEVKAHDAAYKFSGQGGLYSIVLAHAIGYDWRKLGLKMTYIVAYFGTADNEMQVEPKTYEYDRLDIEDMIETKLERLHRMKNYADSQNFPRRSHGCDFYGSPCGFLDVCSHRDPKFIKRWFDFEVESGRMSDYQRIYLPVWSMQA